ncbi:MAG: DUF4157 domain-containing protein, partial [Gemmatimonadaceae bacterium]
MTHPLLLPSLDASGTRHPAQLASAGGPIRLLQRQCACGTHAATGTCEDCRRSELALQRKLAVGSSDDPLEHEAERAADAVMGGAGRTAAGVARPRVQRRAQGGWRGLANAPPSVERALSGAGAPLPRNLHGDMERAFGHDFSRVRVHTGSAAERSARDVSAQAYTVGSSIVFGTGAFAPGEARGRRLIAHEL